MAGRILNRRELRKQEDQAEAVVAAVVEASPKKKARAKTAALKKPRARKAPPRLRARWGVFDAGMKQVAIYDYNQRAAADEKLAELLGRNKGIHFLQMVKELMPEAAAIVAPLPEG